MTPQLCCGESKTKNKLPQSCLPIGRFTELIESKKSNLRICGNNYFIHPATKLRGILLINVQKSRTLYGISIAFSTLKPDRNNHIVLFKKAVIEI